MTAHDTELVVVIVLLWLIYVWWRTSEWFDDWIDRQTPLVRGICLAIMLAYIIGGAVCFTIAMLRHV